jgi:hypothetical protein
MFEDDVGGCRRTSEDVVEKLGRCLRMSDNVGKCRKMLENVGKCPRMM